MSFRFALPCEGKRVVVVVPGASDNPFGDRPRTLGVWGGDVAAVRGVLAKQGCALTFASPGGSTPRFDAGSGRAAPSLGVEVLDLGSLDAAGFDGVFVCGGLGAYTTFLAGGQVASPSQWRRHRRLHRRHQQQGHALARNNNNNNNLEDDGNNDGNEDERSGAHSPSSASSSASSSFPTNLSSSSVTSLSSCAQMGLVARFVHAALDAGKVVGLVATAVAVLTQLPPSTLASLKLTCPSAEEERSVWETACAAGDAGEADKGNNPTNRNRDGAAPDGQSDRSPPAIALSTPPRPAPLLAIFSAGGGAGGVGGVGGVGVGGVGGQQQGTCVRFRIRETLEQLGARVTAGAEGCHRVVVSGALVTAQNPCSAEECARQVLHLLQSTLPQSPLPQSPAPSLARPVSVAVPPPSPTPPSPFSARASTPRLRPSPLVVSVPLARVGGRVGANPERSPRGAGGGGGGGGAAALVAVGPGAGRDLDDGALDGVVKDGWAFKQSRYLKAWRRRWVVLSARSVRTFATNSPFDSRPTSVLVFGAQRPVVTRAAPTVLCVRAREGGGGGGGEDEDEGDGNGDGGHGLLVPRSPSSASSPSSSSVVASPLPSAQHVTSLTLRCDSEVDANEWAAAFASARPSEWDSALLRDEVDKYSVDVGNGVRRHLLARDGLVSLPFPDKPHINTLFKLLEHAAYQYKDNDCYGEREVHNANADADVDGGQGNGNGNGNGAQATKGAYSFVTFGEFFEAAVRFGAGLQRMCGWLRPGDCVGILARNSLRWVLAQHGCFSQSLTVVPMYDTLGAEDIAHIVASSRLSTVVVAPELVPVLGRALDHIPSVVKAVVVMTNAVQPEWEALFTTAISRGLLCKCVMLSFGEVSTAGGKRASEAKAEVEAEAEAGADPGAEAEAPHELDGALHEVARLARPPEPDSVCVVLYTSGTTSRAKGVKLTHQSVLAVATGLHLTAGNDLSVADCYLSYLPLAHGYEQCMHATSLIHGTSIGFYSGTVQGVMDDIRALRPTILAGVPRVFQRIRQACLDVFDKLPWLKRVVVLRAIQSQVEALRRGDVDRQNVIDRLVLSQLRDVLGGRVRLLCTGAAPLPPDLFEFLTVCFGCPVAEGYGLTESSGVCCASQPGNQFPGHVGAPLPCCEIKLQSVPEMGYCVSDQPRPRGEVLVRGFNVMAGLVHEYDDANEDEGGEDHDDAVEEGQRGEEEHDQPAKPPPPSTPRRNCPVDSEGWLHTGDIGCLNRNGTLTVIDRKWNLVKVGHSRVSLERVESVLMACRLVGQISVHQAEGGKGLVAVVVPNPGPFLLECKARGMPNVVLFPHDGWRASLRECCVDEDMVRLVANDLTTLSVEKGLARRERLLGVHLEGDLNELLQGFSVENGCLTPTFKLKRVAIAHKYRDVFGSLGLAGA